MTWLHLLNDCAEINKMLNVPIQKLSTLHYPLSRAPAPHDGADHPRVKQSEIDNPFVTLVSRRG